MAKKSKKADYTEYKTPICKTSWLQIFEVGKSDKEKIIAAGGDLNSYRRKGTFMLPKNVDAIEINLSKEGKAKIVAQSKKFVDDIKKVALKMALENWDDCANAEELEEEEIRWNPILDGDSRKMLKASKGNAGFWILRAGSTFTYSEKGKMPNIYDSKNLEVVEKGTLKSGDWVKSFLTLFTYKVDGSSGVTFGMNNIKKCYEGSYTGIETDDFGDDDEIEELETLDGDFDTKKTEEDEWEE